MFKSLRLWIGVVLGLGLLAWFLYGTDFGEMARALRGAQYLYLLPAVAVYFVSVGFRTLRWHYLLRPLKAVSSRRLFPLVVIGYMANNLLPARLGEVVRSYMVGEKEGVSKTAAFATVVVERLFDGLALVIFLVVLVPLVPLGGWLRGVSQEGQVSAGLVLALFAGVAGFMLALLALLFLLALYPPAARALGRLLLRVTPQRLRGRAGEVGALFHSGLEALKSPSQVLMVLLLSGLVWLAELTMYYLVTFSFSLGSPFPEIMFGGAAANVAISVPALPGGIGPFEIVFLGTLTRFGVGRELASAYVIVLHAALLVPVTALGLALLWRENLSLAQLIRPRSFPGRMAPAGPEGPSVMGGED